MAHLLADLRFGLRLLLKSPVVTAAALLSLAVGIGANTTIISILKPVLLQPLPVVEPQRLLAVYMIEEGSDVGTFLRMSHPNFRDLAERNEVFSGMAEIAPAPAIYTAADGEPESISGQLATANFLSLLGVRPQLGRDFRAEEDGAPSSHPVVILSHRFWVRRLGADPGILERTIALNGQPFTVVGVAPPGFHGTLLVVDPAFWTPMAMHETFLKGERRKWIDDRRALLSRAIGRLRDGVSPQQAALSLAALGKSLAAEHPVENERRSFAAMPLSQASVSPGERRQFGLAGALLMTVVALVLLVACGNVANLLLARAAGRRREIAVRLALGATRRRLVLQLLTESLLLSLAAGGLGLLLARWGRDWLWASRPPFLEPTPVAPTIDATVLLFTLVLSCLTGLVFGLAPALLATRLDVVTDLKGDSSRRGGRGRLPAPRDLLVAAQVALSLVALAGAALFLRSLARATAIDLGFARERLASVGFDVSAAGFDRGRARELTAELVAGARALPGINGASLAATVPLADSAQRRTVILEGQAGAAGSGQLLPVNAVTPTFFEVLGIPLRGGRRFEAFDREGSAAVAIVNTAAARLLWPGASALGQRLKIYGRDTLWEVVGEVGDTKLEAVGEAAPPQIYLPFEQSPSPTAALIIAAVDPAAALSAVKGEMRRLAPSLPQLAARTMNENLQRKLWAARLAAALLAALAALALVLAAIGLYGVASFSVAERNHELGLRAALGAEPGALTAMIVRHGLMVVAIGLAAGLAVALLAGKSVAALLYGLPPNDPFSFALTVAILLGVGFLANLLPARRATGIDPARVIRRER